MHPNSSLLTMQVLSQADIWIESACICWFVFKVPRGTMHYPYLLNGLIDMEKAYPGASKHEKKRGYRTERQKIAAKVSKDTVGFPKFVHLQKISDIKAATLQNVVDCL